MNIDVDDRRRAVGFSWVGCIACGTCLNFLMLLAVLIIAAILVSRDCTAAPEGVAAVVAGAAAYKAATARQPASVSRVAGAAAVAAANNAGVSQFVKRTAGSDLAHVELAGAEEMPALVDNKKASLAERARRKL